MNTRTKRYSTISLLALLFLSSCATRNGVDSEQGIKSEHFVIYAKEERSATIEKITSLLENKYAEISAYFNMEIPVTNVYIYKSQREFQRQKYGLIADVLKLDWYIGDNIKDSVYLTSPNTNVKGHSYDGIINAVQHEFVHTVVYRINKKCKLWLNEGVALYFSNRDNDKNLLKKRNIPKIKIFETKNPIYFADNGGYQFADKFTEFFLKEYGKENLVKMIKSKKYSEISGISDVDLYNNWKDYLVKNYDN